MTATTIKLTEKEADLLSHRWEVPDCIEDVFEEDFAENSAFEAALWVAYDEVGDMLRKRELTVASPEQAELLKELCNGSTWVAASHADTSAIYSAANRVADSLERKMAKLGIQVDIPRR